MFSLDRKGLIMAREPRRASPQEVLTAYGVFLTKRAENADERHLPSSRPEEVQALLDTLEHTKELMFGVVVERMEANTYDTRVPLKDLSDDLREFFGRVHANREIVDALRQWFKPHFGDRIRVEGDSHYAGLYLELA